MQSQDFFCHLPFVSMTTDGTTAAPCCKFRSKQPIPLDGYNKNPQVTEACRLLYHGQAPMQCMECVKEEKVSSESIRTLANKFHPHLTEEVLSNGPEYSNIRYVDIVGGNTCNLMCLPCIGGSYIRDKELHDLGLISYTPMVIKQNSLDVLLAKDIEILTLCAGEPFFDKKSWEFLERLAALGKSKKIRLDINTNLTHITSNKLDFLIENFRSVLIKGSIDGVGIVNDYLRYPSDWHTIQASVDLIKNYDQIEFIVTTALSNLSLLRFDDLVPWVVENEIKNLFISQVMRPEVLAGHVIPQDLALHLLARLESLKSKHDLADRTLHAINLSQNLCKHAHADREQIKNLQQFLDLHDKKRGTSWRNVFPELAHFVDNVGSLS